MTAISIKKLRAHEILDSRGSPTVEVILTFGDDQRVTAAVPSGASTGQYEAHELRDADPARYGGKGVLRACRNVEQALAPAFLGKNVTAQQAMDALLVELDGTPNKERLGANALLAVSLALARAGAAASHLPLYQYLRQTYMPHLAGYPMPVPMLNVLNGGRHADNGLDFQEYMIVPHAPVFAERVRIAAEIYMHLGALLHARGLSTLVGDEGGFAPHLPDNRAPLDLITAAIDRTSSQSDQRVMLAIDVAASEFYRPKQKKYFLHLEQQYCTAEQMIARYVELTNQYPIAAIEDGLAEDDWEGWQHLTKRLHEKVLLVGDDLFVTNTERLQRGITLGAANAVIIKPNQIGTLTETVAAVQLAQAYQYAVVISHRSGDTNDSFIADLAVAVQASYIKAGAVARSERLAKYNRLLDIEADLA